MEQAATSGKYCSRRDPPQNERPIRWLTPSLRYFCSPQHTDSALYPIISQMERAAGFTHEETALPEE
jgi:hypothetical protein